MAKQKLQRVLDQSNTSAASFVANIKSLLYKLQLKLHANPTIVPLVVLIVSIIVFTIISNGKFLSLYNANVILQRVSIIGMLAMAQTLIILTAGIDLSIGAIMIFSTMLMGHFAVHMGVPAPIAIILAIVVAGAIGLLNGVLIAKIKLPPFIATLGTWRIFYAVTFIIFGSQSIRGSDIDVAAPLLKYWGNTLLLGPMTISFGSIVFIIFAVSGWYVLRHTAWGRHVYAVGDDEESAKLSGIRTGRTLISVYVVAGALAGFTGWMVIGRLGSASPITYVEANLQSITAVVIGGISLFGGRGSILGVIFGAFIVQVFDSGLNFTALDTQVKYLALGLLIIIAVAIDQWIRKVS